MRQARHLISIPSEQAFNEQVLNSHEFWIVVFLDGFDCSACQTAKTNVMRLAASLKGLSDVKVGIVNCEDPGITFTDYEKLTIMKLLLTINVCTGICRVGYTLLRQSTTT